MSFLPLARRDEARRIAAAGIWVVLWASGFAAPAAAETPVDLASYDPTCKVQVVGWNGHLRLSWPLSEKEPAAAGEITLDLNGGKPILQKLVVRAAGDESQSAV